MTPSSRESYSCLLCYLRSRDHMLSRAFPWVIWLVYLKTSVKLTPKHVLIWHHFFIRKLTQILHVHAAFQEIRHTLNFSQNVIYRRRDETRPLIEYSSDRERKWVMLTTQSSLAVIKAYTVFVTFICAILALQLVVRCEKFVVIVAPVVFNMVRA